jgi:hypothetical protein
MSKDSKTNESRPEVWGILASFGSTQAVYRACAQIKEMGFTCFDAYTPFPVHGLDRAMGLKPSKVPWIVLVMGLLGAASGMAMQGWMSAIDYPLVIAGKPLFSWQAFVPVTFELSILFGALGAVLGMFLINRLPQYYHPVFHSQAFCQGASDHAFFVAIEAKDELFHEKQTADLFRKLGAETIEVIGH